MPEDFDKKHAPFGTGIGNSGEIKLGDVPLYEQNGFSFRANGFSRTFDNGAELSLRMGGDVLKGKPDIGVDVTIPLDITGSLLGLPPMQRGGRGR